MTSVGTLSKNQIVHIRHYVPFEDRYRCLNCSQIATGTESQTVVCEQCGHSLDEHDQVAHPVLAPLRIPFRRGHLPYRYQE